VTTWVKGTICKNFAIRSRYPLDYIANVHKTNQCFITLAQHDEMLEYGYEY